MAFFSSELEGVATFWRIFRKDGVALAFVSHDRALWFDGLLHRAAPGMLPSAIRLSARLDGDSAEVNGVLDHETISAADLSSGRFDGAAIQIGAVDWETLESAVLYNGRLGTISYDGMRFAAEMESAKSRLNVDPIPRTSPACRAQFCGPGCNLSPVLFETTQPVIAVDRDTSSVRFGVADPRLYVGGMISWLDGPFAGLRQSILAEEGGVWSVDTQLPEGIVPSTFARLRQGCDHNVETCRTRFGNVLNFQGEPFLPGNDLLARYPRPQ